MHPPLSFLSALHPHPPHPPQETIKMCFSHFSVANRARLPGLVYFQAYCKNGIMREMISSANALCNLLGSWVVFIASHLKHRLVLVVLL